MIVIERAAVERFRTAVSRRLGLWHDDGKLDQLADVLRDRLDTTRLPIEAYFERLDTTDEARALAELLTVGETFFFRNVDHFRALVEVAVPEARRRQGGARTLHVASIGCASGEEPYTIAILLRDLAEEGWDVRITAADINRAHLARAAAARYSPWSLRATPDDVRAKWFQADGRDFVLDPRIRAMVSFTELNLADAAPAFWGSLRCDVVFWRNVLMYLTPELAARVVERVTNALVPGGHLFLGHAETLRGLSPDFHLRHTHETFYYARRAAGDRGAENELLAPRPAAAAAVPAIVDEGASWVAAIQRASDRIAALSTQRARTDARQPARAAVLAAPAPDLGLVLELARQERFDDALERVQAFPDDRDALLVRAALLTNLGRLPEAEDACRRLLAIAELEAGAHYLMAVCREHAGDRVTALDHAQTAIYLDPGFAMPHLHLGMLSRRAGDARAAQRALGQARILLAREDASRLVLFGGGFSRDALVELCVAELRAAGGDA